MSAPSIDPAIAARLAAVDDALAPLPAALAAVARQPGWRLADVRWTPGEGCRIAVRVATPDATPTFVAIAVSADGWSQHDYRDDAALEGVRDAADPTEIARRLSAVDIGAGSRWDVEPVRYRPGSRCVWRYSAESEDVRTTLYAKTFRAAKFPRQRALVEALEPPRRRRLVPDVVAVWPDLSVIVSAAVDGPRLSAVLGEASVSAVERSRLLYRLGSLLADFHRHPAEGVPSFTAADQVASMTAALAAARRIDPRVGDRLAAVLETLASSQPHTGCEVLGHGSFRAGQVIAGGEGGLTMIDTDGVSRTDPARDLGRVLAHLSWQDIQERELRSAVGGAEGALLDGYGSLAGPTEPDALRWWRAAALIQLAARRYSRVEHDAWPLVPCIVDEAERVLSTSVARPTRTAELDLLNIDVASELVRPVLAPDVASSGSIKVISAVRLATRSRRRMVVRYRVSGLDSADPMVVIAKAFTDDDHARRLHTNLRLLADGPFASSPLRAPQPLGLLHEQRLVLWVACDGVPLDRITEPDVAEQGVRRAARWLARLHSSNVELPRQFSLDEEAVSTRRWAARIGQADRRLSDPAGRLAEAWVTAVGPDSHGLVPIHKDFHPGHVLIGDDTSVIDLDEARLGDPAFDVAHFWTYLELLSSHDLDDLTLAGSFMDEYVAETGWRDAGSLSGYRAYAWLKIAKQWAIGSGPGHGASRAERLAGAADALARGERCLHA